MDCGVSCPSQLKKSSFRTIQNILMTCLVLGERRCPLGYLFINLCASCKCEHDGKSYVVLKRFDTYLTIQKFKVKVEDVHVLKAPGSLLATDRSKAVVLV